MFALYSSIREFKDLDDVGEKGVSGLRVSNQFLIYNINFYGSELWLATLFSWATSFLSLRTAYTPKNLNTRKYTSVG